MGTANHLVGRTSNDFAISRYLSDGSPDTTFSQDGRLSVDIGSASSDGAVSVSFDSLGRLVVGGFSDNINYAVIRIRTILEQVNISGRVGGSDGRAVTNAILSLDGGNGSVRYARTNQFGYYRFVGAPTGVQTIRILSKGLTFTPRTIERSKI